MYLQLVSVSPGLVTCVWTNNFVQNITKNTLVGLKIFLQALV